MANVKISQLPAATSPVASTDVLPVVQSGVTKKAAINQLGFLQSGTGAASRTIESKLQDTVSVKDFGAVGDGVADDTAAIQAAIDASHEVVIPAGTYKTTSALNLGTQKAIRFVNNASINPRHTGYGIYVSGGGIAGRDYARIINPKFVTTSGTVPAALIAIDGVQNVCIENGVFSDCTATVGVLNLNGYGLRLDGAVFNWFTGTGVRLRQSIGDTPYFSYDVAIRDIDISNHTGIGVDVGGGNLTVFGGVIESCSLGGVKLSSDTAPTSGIFVGTYFEANANYHVKSFGDNAGNWPTIMFSGARFIGTNALGNVIDCGAQAYFTFDSCVGYGSTLNGVTFAGSIGNVQIKNCTNIPLGDVPTGIRTYVSGRDVFFGNATATQINSLNVNANFGGGGALIAVSSSTGSGNASVSELWHIRFGVDTNNFTATSLSKLVGGGSAASFAFSVDTNGYLVVTASSAGFACFYQVIARWH